MLLIHLRFPASVQQKQIPTKSLRIDNSYGKQPYQYGSEFMLKMIITGDFPRYSTTNIFYTIASYALATSGSLCLRASGEANHARP